MKLPRFRLLMGNLLLVVVVVGCSQKRDDRRSELTFAEHIAPIVFANCSGCHRPGESAPFPLLTYRDVQKRSEQIVEVTRSRYMPPWLPSQGLHSFVGERRLTEEQIAKLADWVGSGAPEGPASALPELPKWPEGWQLGEPDLVVGIEESFRVPEDGEDVFRNFVLRVPDAGERFVRAVEIRAGNPAVVHHAWMAIDTSRSCLRLDLRDDGPGFEGMDMGYSTPPEGHLLGWTPGKMPHPGFDRMAWPLNGSMDLVLQLHLRPSGKPEAVRPAVGIHFAKRPPELRPFGLLMKTAGIDIPAGKKHHVIEQTFTIPVDCKLLSIYPHAHYICKSIDVVAASADGNAISLLNIPDWDFNWQDQYTYENAPVLRKGTTIRLRLVYDNSTDNPRNPSDPPVRVMSGDRSIDEMGNVWMQLLPEEPSDLAVLRLASYRHSAEHGPSLTAYYNLGTELQSIGQHDEAIGYFEMALKVDPEHAILRHNYAGSLAATQRLDEAIQHMQAATQIDPEYASAHLNLGHFFARKKLNDRAMECYRKTLALDPKNPVARQNLEILEKAASAP